MALTPHFAYPFAFNAKGQSVVVEQDSEADLRARAANVCVCPEGFRDELPEYGIPPLLFDTIPLPIAEVQAAIAKWAEVDLSVSEHAEGVETAVRKVLAEVAGPA